jgi:hypothetical protein
MNAPWLESLRSVRLSSNRLGTPAAQAIARCQKLSNLKHLDLSGNSIAGTGLKALAGSAHLRNLSTLLLGRPPERMRPPSASSCYEFLAKLDLPKLRQLDLSGLPIDARSMRLLAGEKFRTLTRLNLAYCHLDDVALPELLTAPALQGLIELKLYGNNLNKGLVPLADRRVLPQLSDCTLNKKPIAQDLSRRLARRLGVIFSEYA